MTSQRARPRVLVTGASSGLGRYVARQLAHDGMDVVLVSRRQSVLEEVRRELSPGDHACYALDVRDEAAWKRAERTIAPEGRLAGVVTAAGLLTPVGRIGTWNVDEFRTTIEVNLIGTLNAIAASLNFLRADSGAAVVTFSGGGATGPMSRYDAYAASKAAVVRLTENLAVDLSPTGIRLNSVAPGFVLTGMHNATIEAGPTRAGRDYYERTRLAMEVGGQDSPERPARLVAFLLSAAAAGITGKLISARWDPWEDPTFLVRLREERDLATLRRIDDHYFASLPTHRSAAP